MPLRKARHRTHGLVANESDAGPPVSRDEKMDLTDLEKRYRKLYPESPTECAAEIEKIEAKLGVRLPEDVMQIGRFLFGGYPLGGVILNALTIGEWDNVVHETQRLRDQIGLPNSHVVLMATDELILLETSPGKNYGKVFRVEEF